MMLSADQLAKVVRRAAGGTSRVLEHRTAAYSDVTLGFIGELWSLEVLHQRLSSPEPPESLKLFVKNVGMSNRSTVRDRRTELFMQEVAFFTELLPLLLESSPRTEAFAPSCWLATDGLLVMEDLRAKGYNMLDGRRRQLTGEQLCAAVRAQARLHAASLLTEARFGRPVDQLSPDSCVERIFSEPSDRLVNVEIPLELAARLACRLGREPGPIVAALRWGYMRICRSAGRGKLARVVSHGDTWTNNYLFDESQQPVRCILVDFQLARYAPRTFDVAQLMYLCASRETRSSKEAQVIRAYHQELCASLQANRPDLELPSLEDVMEEYEDVRLSAMYAYLDYHPIISMNPKCLVNCTVDEFFQKVLFRKDNDALIEAYDQNPEYFNGLLELVKELIDYCDTHDVPGEDYSDSEVNGNGTNE